MRIPTQDKASWSGEYKRYRSTDEKIQENREANKLQREKDDHAAGRNSNASNTDTAGSVGNHAS